MLLLGNFESGLTAFLYQQLLSQLETSISAGEYGGGTLFDTSAAQAIQAQGQNFTSITMPASGNTAYADDVNTPLNALQARYNAITSEVASLQAQIPTLLALIAKEADLIDKTIAAAEVEEWAAQQPDLTTSQVSVWNFESGHGVTDQNYPNDDYNVDPNNSVAYLPPVIDASYVIPLSLGGSGTITQGIGSPINRRTIPVKQVQWQFTPSSAQSQFEEIYGNDQSWAYLASLEPSPLLTFGSPNINVILPVGGTAAGLFQASGSVAGGQLPVYVRLLFYPRQNQISVTNAVANQNITLSIYNVTADTVQAFTPSVVYNEGTDFTVNDTSVLTVLSSGNMVGQSFTVMFEEYYPAYQCSIDQTNWSPIFMLDPNRVYPDDTTNFLPINVQNGQFPLMDELGVPLGLFIQMTGTPTQEMELQVITPASTTFGENAQLIVSLERAVYMTGLQLTPFTNFPSLIQSITAYGFTDNISNVVLNTPVLLDRSVTIQFPRQLIRKFAINLYQQNYSLKEYLAEAPDALRRDTLASLQATLPFSVQRPPASIPNHYEGAMYEFGIQNILAVDDAANLPGVFASGPYLVEGMPELVRLDVDVANISNTPTNSIYLGYVAFDGNDNILEQNELSFTPGATIVYPGTHTADHVDFYVKFVFRNALSVAKKLKLQVTTT